MKCLILSVDIRALKKYLHKEADYGVLKDLEGTWANYKKPNGRKVFGLHTTCMPSPGTNSETIPGKFTFLCENYTEELTFTLVPGVVRNRAGTNEQFCGAIKYESTIHNEKRELIHVENGMYLTMNDMYSHPADEESVKRYIGEPELIPGDGIRGPFFVPDYTIARSGTIPHGSTVTLFGDSKITEKAPEFPKGIDTWDFAHLAISPSMGGADTRKNGPINLDLPPPDWVFDTTLPERDPSGNRTYTQRILAHELYPYSVRPDLRLRDVLRDQTVTRMVFIGLSTESAGGPHGGILNTPIITKYVPVTQMIANMWLETIIENGKEVLQLQYEQIQHFEFHFGTDGGTTVWPHIQVNTLRKVPTAPKPKPTPTPCG